MKKLTGRVSADADEEFVVFLIGMHVNRWRRVREWTSVARAMLRMLRELRAHPELGLLHAEAGLFFGGLGVIEYWRSFEELEAYARSTDHAHLPAWRAYNRLARESRAVGIYHETYCVSPDGFEALHHNMPVVGSVAAHGARPLDRGSTSALRLGARRNDAAPVDAPPVDAP